MNFLFNGDCIIGMKNLKSNSIDLIYCDLPYGTTQCKWDEVIPFDEMWKQCERIIKPNGAIVFHAQQPFTSALIMSNPKMFKYTWVWEKSKATGFLNAKIRPLVAHEDIVVSAKGKPPYYPQMTNGTAYNKGVRKEQTDNDVYGSFEQVEVKSNGTRYPRSVQYFKTAESEGKTYHKTQKPLNLSKYIISTYSNEGEVVLDFTMGSGTSGVACLELNRSFIGMENDSAIFETAQERIAEAKSKLADKPKARGQINLWDNAEQQPMKNEQPLCLRIVSGSALADAYHGGWRRSKKYAKETNFHGLNRKEIKKYFDKWYEEHYR